MTLAVPRSVVEDFYKVYATRDAEKIAAYLHDDIEWNVSGPVDVLAFCGTFRGKADVLDLIQRLVPQTMRVFSFVPESILIDGDRVAMLNRQSATRTLDGRVISFRVANFMRFQDCQVIENVSLIDSFDAVEQVLGHSLAVHGARAMSPGNIVAL